MSNMVDTHTTELGLQIASKAKEYVGVPYYHCGRDKNGLDCAGLVIKVMHDLGQSTWDEIDYSSQVNAKRFLHCIERFFDLVRQGPLWRRRTGNLWDPEPGDLLLFSIWGNPQHVGWYVGNGQIVHAYDKLGIQKVVQHSLDVTWKRIVIGTYRWTGDKELKDNG